MEQVKPGQLWLLLSEAEAGGGAEEEVLVEDTSCFPFTDLRLDTGQ